MERRDHPGAGQERGGDPARLPGPGSAEDVQSRCIEAAVQAIVIGCLKLSNGNPQPAPKFRLKVGLVQASAATRPSTDESETPVVLAGDYK